MAISNEKVTKALSKNYLEVQKKELTYKEFVEKNNKLYNDNLKNNASELQESLAVLQVAKKEVQAKFKNLVTNEKTRNKNVLENLKQELADSELTFETELKLIVKGKNEKDAFLVKEREKTLKKFEKLQVELLKKLDDTKEKYNKKKIELEEKKTKDILHADEKIQADNQKYTEKVESIIIKKAEKLAKVEENYLDKKAKLEEKAVHEKEKINAWKKTRHEKYEKELNDIETEIATEQSEFDTKHDGIVSSMDSRVVRREKFLKRSQSEGDSNGAKIQTKEIKKIKADTAKEIKLLTKSHDEAKNNLKDKRIKFIKEYLKEISVVDLKLANFIEDNLNDLVLLKIDFEKDTAFVIEEFDSKVNNETKENIEYFESMEKKKAELLNAYERQVLDEDNTMVLLQNEYNFNKKSLELDNDITLRQYEEQEFNNTFTYNADKELNQIELEKRNSENHSKELIEAEQHKTNLLLLEEKRLIDLHKLTFDQQVEKNKSHKVALNEYSKVLANKALELKQYEELEITNRYNLKIEFIQSQISELNSNTEVSLKHITAFFDDEVKIYQAEIDSSSKTDLAEITEFETIKKEAIEKETQKRNTLDPSAYRKQIKELDKIIQEMKEELSDELTKKQSAIDEKTAVFNRELLEALHRKELAISELTYLSNTELQHMNNLISDLQENKAAELKDIELRKTATDEGTTLFTKQNQVRFDKATAINEAYKENRKEYQNFRINALTNQFEDVKNALLGEQNETIQVLNNNQEFSISERDKFIKEKQDLLVSQIDQLEGKRSEAKVLHENMNDEQKANFNKNSGRLDVKNKNHNTSITNAVFEKMSVYNKSVTETETAKQTAINTYDKDDKNAKIAHKNGVAKATQTIETKLKQDISTVN